MSITPDQATAERLAAAFAAIAAAFAQALGPAIAGLNEALGVTWPDPHRRARLRRMHTDYSWRRR